MSECTIKSQLMQALHLALGEKGAMCRAAINSALAIALRLPDTASEGREKVGILDQAIAEGERIHASLFESGPSWQAAQNGAALVCHALVALRARVASEPGRWTREAPTEAGWYWVYVKGPNFVSSGVRVRYMDQPWSSELRWSLPILPPPPERET